MTKRWMIALLVLLAIAAVIVSVATSGGSGGGDPLRTADDLAATPDDRLELAVLRELGRSVYHEGADADAWRRLGPRARHLWSVSALADITPSAGLGLWLKSCRSGSPRPGPQDIRDGLEDMGLAEARQVMDEIIALPSEDDVKATAALQDRLFKAIRTKAFATTRLAWIRAHLDELTRY